ncbi:CHC2 zinc finger domain-containing protein [Rhodoferax bucti]|uniref:CHC2 zinc finger domain-containing protein n=1 Tax=Rhodoferax bucti TaxID=2576305 RepID=UPI001108FC6D|nr:CHC2 zinc finger domain-containing protein [Rhodoferax bucti]
MGFDRNLLPEPTSYFESKGLKLSGPARSKWKTTDCSFHGGNSMRVNAASGAWVCMNCGEKGGDVLAYEIKTTGNDFVDAAKHLGAWVEDGRQSLPQKPTPLSPRQALSVMAFEATLIAVAAGNVANGVSLTDVDQARVMVASNRITRLVEAFQ